MKKIVGKRGDGSALAFWLLYCTVYVGRVAGPVKLFCPGNSIHVKE